MIKLVIADLDGTLVHNQQISRTNIEIIKKLQDKGYLVSIATGRHVNAVVSIYNELGLTGPVICSNGAFVVDPITKEVINQFLITPDVALDTMNMLNSIDADYLLYTSKEIVGTQKSADKLSARLGKNMFYIEVIDIYEMTSYNDKEVVKVLIIEYDKDKYNKIKQGLSNIEGIRYLSSNSGFIDAGPIEADKGNALKSLCDFHGITVDEVISFGDQENDIGMIKAAGIGVAMGNGIKELKAIANEITLRCEDDGFAYGVNKWVLKE